MSEAQENENGGPARETRAVAAVNSSLVLTESLPDQLSPFPP